MALILKDSPVGVDKSVDTIQKALYAALVTNGTWTNYQSYHRAYRNETENGVKPELFTGNGNDYVDAYMDDQFTVTSFFLVEDETEIIDDMFTSDISVIFQVNLNKLYTTAPHRFDEEFRNQIVKIFKDLNGTFSFNSITTSIDGVYAGLNTEQVRLNDTHPCHVVRYELTANYQHACGNIFATTGATCDITAFVTTEDETSIGAGDGTATASTTGTVNGTLSYLWDTIPPQTTQEITGLDAGTYGVTITDSIPTSPACTSVASGVVGSPDFAIDNSLLFNGSDEYVLIPTETGGSTFTIVIWYSAVQTFFRRIIGGDTSDCYIRLNNGAIGFRCGGSDIAFPFDNSEIFSKKQMLTITSNGSEVNAYLGETPSTANPIAYTSGSFNVKYFGRYVSSAYFQGQIAYVIWQIGFVATDANVATLWNNGDGSQPSLVLTDADGDHPMEGTGNDMISLDISSTPNNGSLEGYEAPPPDNWVTFTDT